MSGVMVPDQWAGVAALVTMLCLLSGAHASLVEMSLLAAPSVEAQLAAAVSSSGQTLSGQTLQLLSDLTLTQALPAMPFGGNLTLKGSCPGGRRCRISDQGKFGFLSSDTVGVSVTLVNLYFSNFKTPVLSGSIDATVKSCKFVNNKASPIAVSFQITQVVVHNSWFENCSSPAAGGAVSITQAAGVRIAIGDSVFIGNSAPAGGALAVPGGSSNGVVIRNSLFKNNRAAMSGGALSIGGSITQIFASKFIGNRAAAGAGGAVELQGVQGDLVSSPIVFCRNSFRRNGAKNKKSGNIFINGSPSTSTTVKPAEVRFCPSRPSATGIPRAAKIVKSASCVGCTGCMEDCYGRGTCRVEGAKLRAACTCKGNYNPASGCSTCLSGYVGATCATCYTPGFVAAPGGQCTACSKALYDLVGLAPASDPFGASFLSAQKAASAKACKSACAADSRCNKYAYFDKSSTECPSVCFLLLDDGECVGAVNYSPHYRLTYQFYEPRSCGNGGQTKKAVAKNNVWTI